MKFAQSLQVAIKVSAVATVFAFSAVVSTAHADSLSATGIQKTQLEKLQFGNVAESTVNTGAFEVKLASAPTTPFWVYCLDPLEGFNNSTNATTSMSLFTYLNGGQYAGQFSGSNYANAVAGGYQAQNTNTVLTKLVDLYSHAYNDSLMNSTKSAAFQYAVWEVIGGTDYSGTSSNSLRYGANNTDANFKSAANVYLAGLSTGSWGSLAAVNDKFTYTVYTSDPSTASQNLLRVTSSTNNNTGAPVPEPGSLALVSAAFAGLVYSSRRRKTA
jgi:hypothetical protein